MPVTLLHYPAAYFLKRLNRRLSLPALVVGAIIPDIEVPILILFFSKLPDHLIMHSLIGAVTINLILAVLVTNFLYRPIIPRLFSVDKEQLNQACSITLIMVWSSLLGILSHLFIDYPMHMFNPLLWPWINPYDLPGQLVTFFSNGDLSRGYTVASQILHILMLIALLIILARNWGPELWQRIWLGE